MITIKVLVPGTGDIESEEAASAFLASHVLLEKSALERVSVLAKRLGFHAELAGLGIECRELRPAVGEGDWSPFKTNAEPKGQKARIRVAGMPSMWCVQVIEKPVKPEPGSKKRFNPGGSWTVRGATREDCLVRTKRMCSQLTADVDPKYELLCCTMPYEIWAYETDWTGWLYDASIPQEWHEDLGPVVMGSYRSVDP